MRFWEHHDHAFGFILKPLAGYQCFEEESDTVRWMETERGRQLYAEKQKWATLQTHGLCVSYTENTEVETSHLLGTWCRRCSLTPLSRGLSQMAFLQPALKASAGFWNPLFLDPLGTISLVIHVVHLPVFRSNQKANLFKEQSPLKITWLINSRKGWKRRTAPCTVSCKLIEKTVPIERYIWAVKLVNFSGCQEMGWFWL